ncbi:S-adenosylmethionine decarboxylase [Paenibacillus thalictri]|uniref:S-adenosylmethionine decarboxylase n=1 Tax=Paenibacillus thalictri TaxID=2527873 RepID=A0A4V6MSJ9_9BACL|nr:S-adenosylmethionine decarboxylase [Paenibacillus thalictri]
MRLGVYILIGLFAVWTVVQVAGAFHGTSEKGDPGKLLYQVSLFQMELLGSYLHDTDKTAAAAGSLNELKQVLYSASFTHEHLVMAYGEDQLTPLQSLGQLQQYLIRLQIGGQRPLKPDESQTLLEVNKQYNELFDAYGKLFSSGGSVIGSQNDRLVKADKAISELLKKKLFTTP